MNEAPDWAVVPPPGAAVSAVAGDGVAGTLEEADVAVLCCGAAGGAGVDVDVEAAGVDGSAADLDAGGAAFGCETNKIS